MEEERRQCPRVPCKLPASFADLEAAGHVPIPLEHTTTILDLSPLGVRFTSPEPVPVSDRLRLTLQLPGHGTFTARLFSEWSSNAAPGSYEVGASFLLIGEEEKAVLSSFVRQGRAWAGAVVRRKKNPA
ncbi:MAG TPA: PilZ domain-containing protein [Candidatus Eisenbacteria bacterium]|nr:PilZ domain-containing protein [Candidatus Eisenbacteria bacterium]